MPRKRNDGAPKGGGNTDMVSEMVSGGFGVAMTIPSLKAEVSAIDGRLRLQLSTDDGHFHLDGPLSAADRKALDETFEDYLEGGGSMPLTMVVRRYTPGTETDCTSHGEVVTKKVLDAHGCHMYIRHYLVTPQGKALRFAIPAVIRAHNFHGVTNQPLPEEPGLGYE